MKKLVAAVALSISITRAPAQTSSLEMLCADIGKMEGIYMSNLLKCDPVHNVATAKLAVSTTSILDNMLEELHCHNKGVLLQLGNNEFNHEVDVNGLKMTCFTTDRFMEMMKWGK